MAGKQIKKFTLTDEQSKLVGENIKLVYWFMNRMRLPPIDEGEILSELSLGLCRAAVTYDPGKGLFSTYAIHGLRWKLRKLWRDFVVNKGKKVLSLNLSYDDEKKDRSLMALVADHRDDCVQYENREEIEFLARSAGLSEREQEIIDRCNCDESHRVIGKDHQISHERVRQIKDHAHTRMWWAGEKIRGQA